MAHNSFRTLVAALAFISSGTAFSQELTFQMVSARGAGRNVSCDKNSVQMISAGTNLSLIYDDMKIEMPGDGENRHLVETGTCTVALTMTIPKNYFLTQSSMQLFGGVEKSKGGLATITSAMYMTRDAWSTTPALPGAGVFGLTLLSSKVFLPRQTVSEPLLELSDSKNYSALQQKTMCGWTKSKPASVGLLIQLHMTGTRANRSQTTVLSADGTDANFSVGMKTGKCS